MATLCQAACVGIYNYLPTRISPVAGDAPEPCSDRYVGIGMSSNIHRHIWNLSRNIYLLQPRIELETGSQSAQIILDTVIIKLYKIVSVLVKTSCKSIGLLRQ